MTFILWYRRSLFEQHGIFDELFRIAGDYELLLRELNSADAEFIPGLITVAVQQGGISIGPQNSLKWDGLSASVIKNYLVSMG